MNEQEEEYFFRVLEKVMVFRVITNVNRMDVTDKSQFEIKQTLKEIGEYLLEREHGALELVYPSSLYMSVIKSIVYGSGSDGQYYDDLPRLTRFHVSYYEELAHSMEMQLFDGLLQIDSE